MLMKYFQYLVLWAKSYLIQQKKRLAKPARYLTRFFMMSFIITAISVPNLSFTYHVLILFICLKNTIEFYNSTEEPILKRMAGSI